MVGVRALVDVHSSIFVSIECFDLRCKEDRVLGMSWFDLSVEIRRQHEDGVAAVRGRAGMGWDRHQGAGPGGGWVDGLEGRMRPDRARQLETHVQGRPVSPAQTGLRA